MQKPCPHPQNHSQAPVRRRCRPAGASAMAALVLGLAFGASVASPSSSPSSVTDQAARWLATQLQMPADKVTVLAPDPRLKMPQCSTGVKFDTPFSNANTVRARCEAPQWQLFLRAQWPEAALAPVGEAAQPVGRPSPSTVDTARAAAPDTTGRTTAAAPKRALALTRGVTRGALLSPASVEVTQVPAREADSLLITDAQGLDQMEAVRDLPAGTPLRQTDVRPAVLVRQGQLVTMTVGQGTAFTITVRLEALQDGRMGERVTLRNTESGRTVSGVVNGMNSVKGA